jgi:hypothetical protein
MQNGIRADWDFEGDLAGTQGFEPRYADPESIRAPGTELHHVVGRGFSWVSAFLNFLELPGTATRWAHFWHTSHNRESARGKREGVTVGGGSVCYLPSDALTDWPEAVLRSPRLRVTRHPIVDSIVGPLAQINGQNLSICFWRWIWLSCEEPFSAHIRKPCEFLERRADPALDRKQACFVSNVPER